MKQIKRWIVDVTNSLIRTLREKLDLSVKAKNSSRYKLANLIAQCDPNAPKNPTIAEWENTPPVGKEVL